MRTLLRGSSISTNGPLTLSLSVSASCLLYVKCAQFTANQLESVSCTFFPPSSSPLQVYEPVLLVCACARYLCAREPYSLLMRLLLIITILKSSKASGARQLRLRAPDSPVATCNCAAHIKHRRPLELPYSYLSKYECALFDFSEQNRQQSQAAAAAE